jgi:uncharacterized protein involved in outer membrane biogenesis
MNEPDASTPPDSQPPLLAKPAPRKGRWWKWLLGIAAVLFCLGVAVVFVLALSFNRIVRDIARNAIEKNTGLPTQIEELRVSFLRPSIHLRGLRLANTTEFGGGTFLDLPELRVEADRAAFSDDSFRLKLVRLNLAEVHVVADQKGRRNTDVIKQQADAVKAAKPAPRRRGNQKQFAGLDKLDLSVGAFRYSDLGDPSQSHTVRFDWTNQVMTNIVSREALGSNLLLLMYSKGATIDAEKANDPFSILQLIGVFFGAK